MIAAFIEQIKTICHDQIALQRAQFVLFVPVLMALGIGAYFSLRFEPDLVWAGIAFLLCGVGVFFARGGVRLILSAVLLFVLGFGAAQFRTHSVYTPILAKAMKFADVEGRVEAIEALDKGVRVLLSDVVIDDLSPDETPRKVRLKLWKGGELRVGQRIKGLAGLNPPSPPVMPRGFDFQRHMYFKGIGAVGFMYKPPEVVGDVRGGFIERLRYGIGQRINAGLGQPQSGLAQALMIGQRASIGEGDMEAIRVSGLAHMLAISGLHIGLFSGVLFFIVRAFMACFPSFALRYPIKKYAAVIAIFGGLFYMLIAGASIPAQRAMISVLVFFTAVLLDRSAISLRVVAFAAFMVLLFFPESLMSVSFQMSFAAVAGLVAFYDWLRPHWSRWYAQAGMMRRAGLYLLGVSMTTVIATLATAPFALFHFQQLASYGLLANLLCVPILGFVIMPLVLGALALMPFGLEGIAFAVIDPALSGMLWIAHWVAGMDGSALHVAQWGFYTLMLCVAAGLSFVLLRGWFRVIFGSFMIVAALLSFQVKQSDILISSQYDLIALRSDAPYLHVSSRKAERFSLENWERSMDKREKARVFPKEGAFEADGLKASCGEGGCRFELKGRKIAVLRSEGALDAQEDCAWADIVLSKQPVSRDCGAAYVFDKFDVYRHGAHAITLGGDVSVERSEDFRGARLWASQHQKAEFKKAGRKK